MIFWYEARHQKRAESSKLELQTKFLFAASCNLQQILCEFLEKACSRDLWQVADKLQTRSICDDYLHHWGLASSRLESLLMTAATTILLFLDFLLKNDIVILAFFEKNWLKYECLRSHKSSKVTRDETRRAVNDVNNRHICNYEIWNQTL